MRLYRCAVVLALAGMSGGFAAAQPDVPLRLGLECTQEPELALRVTIENRSQAPVPVVLGGILGYHKKYLPGSIRVAVRRDGSPERLLDHVDPTTPGVAGRVDPWLVPLPPGASYTIVLPARHFVSPGEHVPEDFARSARLQVSLRTFEIEPNVDTQGLQFVKPWIGTLRSGWINVSGACRQAAR
jgi:hypothetical protein